jgi:hypothetical protein
MTAELSAVQDQIDAAGRGDLLAGLEHIYSGLDAIPWTDAVAGLIRAIEALPAHIGQRESGSFVVSSAMPLNGSLGAITPTVL